MTKDQQLAALGRRRHLLSASLTIAMMVVYFGFMLLAALAKQWLGTTLVPGLSIGIALGVGVIVTVWVLSWIYATWSNKVYDVEVARLKEMGE